MINAKHFTSRLNCFSPQARLLACFCFACVAAILPNILSATLALIFGVLVVIAFRPPLAYFFRRLFAINLFVIFLWLFTPWATPGEPIYPGSLISHQGVELCILLTLKTNALFCVFICLVSSMSFHQMAIALQKLHFPNKLVAILLFSVRGISIFSHEYTKMKESAALRGFNIRSDLRSYKTVAAMIALLFTRAARRSVILQESMSLRSFDGTVRVLPTQTSFSNDKYLLTVCFLMAVTLPVLAWII